MSDLISRSEAVKIGTDFTFTFEDDKRRYMDFLHYCLNKAPTVEAVPVVHGSWETEFTALLVVYRCSECNCATALGQTNFCPNCGADMRKKVQE